ncbi:AsmA family protein [Hyphomicrobium sp. xq]|uniref:AsmA family protein n=1 Tax=Hyphomicrobium album TaxID=2665159 RepID=A0A6I3KH06_9HYPH|nr:AsmA family protein [Hyphomicrobium album]MTD94264.1 AsmA family protein [Hyphomicrobium album]
MNNGLLYIAGLISLALAALFAVPYFIDWNGYRGVFEEEATRILGREVRVGGDVNVRLLPSPYVSFEKLRIADPSGTTGEPFFRAESFTMRLSAPPLLKGIIEANEIVLEKPVLRLAVDSEGAGNWRSFSVAAGSLPFVPAGVTLQSVKIADGTVAFHGPRGIGFAELGGLNGELKAESIQGPFAFKGTTNWRETEREVRIATGTTEADGSIRFKATVRATSGNSGTYALDGRLEDLKGRPRIDGEITAKVELASETFAAAAEPAPAGVRGKKEAPLIDFKARVAGDAKGLRVDGITLSFEHVGQPQLIAGSATAEWQDNLNVEMALSSRWLDLDKVATSRESAGSPFDTARNFISAMMEALPKNADSKVAFDLDQATLGGDAVSNIKLEVARKQGALLLNNLRAGLPGGAKLAMDGAVADAATGQAFSGDLTLHGTSLARFLDWATKDKALAEELRNDGPFSLQGRLAMSERGIDLTDAGAEFGGRPITGEMRYAKKERPRLSVSLEGAEIEAGEFWPTGVGAFKRIVAGGSEAPGEAKFAWLDPNTTDLHLRVRTGQLVAGQSHLRDVDLDVGIEQGRLSLRAGKFATEDGLSVELQGDVADALKSPRGAVQWVVAAPTRETFATLVGLFDLPEDARRKADAFATLAPMRVAGSLQLGVRKPGAGDIAADGRVQNGGRLVASALLDGGLGNWRAAPADITLTIDSTDVAPIVASFGARGSGAPSAAGAPQPGEVFFKAVGTPSKGMTATASAQATGLFFGYDGRITLPDDGSRAFDGDLRISARALSDAMSVAGLGSGAALSETPVVGTLKLSSANHATELTPQGLSIGGSKIDGSVALSYPSEGPAIVTGDVSVDAASIPSLLGMVLDRKQVAEAPGAEPLAAGKTIWPEHGFDFAALDGVEGKLNVNFGSLVLTDRMHIPNARAEVALAPGKVSIGKLEGKVLGGNLAANVVIERAPGGASLSGDLAIDGMQIRQTGAAGADAAAQASLSLQFTGRGSTPGALVSVAAGKGELKLGELSLHVPTPLAVVSTSEAVLSGGAGGTGEQLVTALRAQIEASEVAVGPRTIPIDIADGAAKLALFALDSQAGTTKVETTVDLASLVVDSAWIVEPRAPDVPQADRPRGGALPSIGVVYTGPLANAWALDSRITAEPLERELAIRRMELDADQLERLRDADSERARRDEERRRALESDDSAAPPPGAPVPVAPAPQAAPMSGALPSADAVPLDPAAPSSASAAPAIPPSSASAPGLVVPPAPGQEGQTFGAAPVDPATGLPAEPGSTTPQATGTGVYRPRRPPERQLQVRDQVMRNLNPSN